MRNPFNIIYINYKKKKNSPSVGYPLKSSVKINILIWSVTITLKNLCFFFHRRESIPLQGLLLLIFFILSVTTKYNLRIQIFYIIFLHFKISISVIITLLPKPSTVSPGELYQENKNKKIHHHFIDASNLEKFHPFNRNVSISQARVDGRTYWVTLEIFLPWDNVFSTSSTTLPTPWTEALQFFKAASSLRCSSRTGWKAESIFSGKHPTASFCIEDDQALTHLKIRNIKASNRQQIKLRRAIATCLLFSRGHPSSLSW